MEAMTPIKDLEVVTLVSISLNHPKVKNAAVDMTFVFDRQPQASDVLAAYASDNFLKRNPHFDDYGTVLAQCLNTFGVPQHGQLSVINADGYQIQTPMLTAVWAANMMGPNDSMFNHKFGHIRVYYKPINIAHREEPKAQAGVLKTEVKKSRDSSSRGLPVLDEPTGLQKSPTVPAKRKSRSKVVDDRYTDSTE